MARIYLEDLETSIYVDHLTVKYEGEFILKELLREINQWGHNNGYYVDEHTDKEYVTEKGKRIAKSFRFHIELEKNYFIIFNLSLQINNMTEKKKKINGFIKPVNKGEITAVLNGFLATTLKSRWETRAYYSFLKSVIDKFVWPFIKHSYKGEYAAKVVSDGKDMMNKMKSLLDMYKHRVVGEEVK